MVETILVIIGLAVIGLLVYVATKPNSFRVERSLAMRAPAEKIFPLIADFHSWTQWSPYEKLDPALQRTYGGAPSGVGATYAYQGNDKVGAGNMEITEAEAPNRMVARLNFFKPFKAENFAEFTIVPQGDTSKVTWAMYGPATYTTKLMGTVFNMDKLVGGQFEEGLANLKAVAEALPGRALPLPGLYGPTELP